MGRDEEIKRQQLQEGHRAFARALASGDRNAFPKDRFGNPIMPGGKVIYGPQVDMVFDVLDVKPVLDPRMKPGLVTIILAVQAPITVGVHGPIPNLLCVAFGDPSAAQPPADGDPVDPPADLPVIAEPPDVPAGEKKSPLTLV